MPETPIELSALLEKTEMPSYVCPDCGSFLDAPRVNPHDGELGRKCCSCPQWHPVTAETHR